MHEVIPVSYTHLSRIADKGMVLVCSAGNSGMGSWKKITPPGDAENVLTVGAVDKKAILAPFSSIGNTCLLYTSNRLQLIMKKSAFMLLIALLPLAAIAQNPYRNEDGKKVDKEELETKDYLQMCIRDSLSAMREAWRDIKACRPSKSRYL